VILLLAAGGYAPQLSTHAFLGIVALWLLVPSATQPALDRPVDLMSIPARHDQALEKP